MVPSSERDLDPRCFQSLAVKVLRRFSKALHQFPSLTVYQYLTNELILQGLARDPDHSCSIVLMSFVLAYHEDITTELAIWTRKANDFNALHVYFNYELGATVASYCPSKSQNYFCYPLFLSC